MVPVKGSGLMYRGKGGQKFKSHSEEWHQPFGGQMVGSIIFKTYVLKLFSKCIFHQLALMDIYISLKAQLPPQKGRTSSHRTVFHLSPSSDIGQTRIVFFRAFSLSPFLKVPSLESPVIKLYRPLCSHLPVSQLMPPYLLKKKWLSFTGFKCS